MSPPHSSPVWSAGGVAGVELPDVLWHLNGGAKPLGFGTYSPFTFFHEMHLNPSPHTAPLANPPQSRPSLFGCEGVPASEAPPLGSTQML